VFQKYRSETPNKRQVRQESALHRQDAYIILTLQEKIARAKARPGQSKRELARLEKQLAKETA